MASSTFTISINLPWYVWGWLELLPGYLSNSSKMPAARARMPMMVSIPVKLTLKRRAKPPVSARRPAIMFPIYV